eukprot:TRINITY_DN2077_c1_g2_i1.p1 TRINITY_DN2077_c1_g2~~TRINITY_DN2077_c1_g2_i1.p1  ORF type:complete len:284 (+),score=24.15 TRINITY_DN2077_c1_g2_i1:66-917(+)
MSVSQNRLKVLNSHVQQEGLYGDIATLISRDKTCGPEFIRLAWHSSGTYDKKDKTGGNKGTMDKCPESDDPANAGLERARGILSVIARRYPGLSQADLWAFASIVAIEVMGGPAIPFFYGRTDGVKCPQTGRLPDASKAADHIRCVFTGQMGFTDQETVALIGAHAVGRCHPDRSGFSGPWTPNPYLFSNTFFTNLLKRTWVVNPSTAGTPNEQYYDNESKNLMMLPADIALTKDPNMLKWCRAYADDRALFMDHFSAAYTKLLNLGWEGKLKGPVSARGFMS